MPGQVEDKVVERTDADVARELADVDAAEAAQLLQSSGSDGAKPSGRDYEAEAGHKGWLPQDQYQGDASKWVDAQTFVERGERFTSNLLREVQDLKEKVAGFEGTKQAFKKFHEESIAKKNEEIKTAISSLRVQRSEAIRNGDDDVAVQLEDRIDLLKDQQKEVASVKAVAQGEEVPRQPGPNRSDPVLQEWIEDGNQWFSEDPKLQAYAVALGETLIKEGETVRGRRFLDKVSELMAVEFPRRFAKGRTSVGRSSAVESGGGASGARGASGVLGGKSERDLPPEDLALMKQFIKEGWTTKDKFLNSYFSRNG